MDSENAACAFTGLLVWILFAAAFWHVGESICQNNHNVADCKGQFRFVPVEPEVME